MVDNGPISFAERRRRLLEERARERGEETPQFQPPPQQFDPVLIPDVLGERSPEDAELDRVIDGIGIVEAYNKWCGKSTPNATGKTEGIKVSCPKPEHPDKDPSAWLNTDKNTWYCGGCEEGGDAYDIAAFSFGYPVPGYKDGQLFHKLREQMAESFGWNFKKVPGGKVMWKDGEESPVGEDMSDSPQDAALDTAGTVEVTASPGPSSVPATESQSTEPDKSDISSSDASVSHLYADDALEELVIYPTIDWRNILPGDTFLHEYMEACTVDDSPEEYHFWHGLIALAHAVGRNVTLDDHRPVYGNLMVCLLGATGTGKSRSRNWLDHVVAAALPYNEDGTQTTGTKIMAVPASGEYLVRAFSYEGRDPSNIKQSLGYKSVNGIVDFDELSALLTRANRQGSTLKPTIMGFADARDQVKIGSLTHGDYIAESPFCSITASTQPKAIRTLLNRTDTGSGFLNRWVFAGGPSKDREVIGGSHSSTVVNLDKAIEELKKVRAYGGFQRSITLEPDALKMLTRFYKEMVFPLQTKDESDLLKRLDLLFKKLILLFTINLKRDTVPADVVVMAIQLWEYVVECYGILNDNIGVTHSQEIAQEIMRHIKRHMDKTGRGASTRDIARYTARKNYSPEQIKKALEVMVALDWVELDKPKTAMGRPTVRYKAVGE